MVEACATGGRQNPPQSSQGLPVPQSGICQAPIRASCLLLTAQPEAPSSFFQNLGYRFCSTSSNTRSKCLLYYTKSLRNFVILCSDTASHHYIGHWHLLAEQGDVLTVAKLTCLISQFPPPPSSSEHLHLQSSFHCQNATELCDILPPSKQCHCFSASLATSSPALCGGGTATLSLTFPNSAYFLNLSSQSNTR